MPEGDRSFESAKPTLTELVISPSNKEEATV